MSEIRDALQRQLGPTYTVERELGGGGMSRVFVVFDQALGRRIAVKVVSPELAASVHLERFMREIQVAATLQNPHIVGVLSTGEVDGLPYFSMPFIDGESLRAHMVATGAMPVRDVVTILRDVARALAYAHERGIVHRDIKPDNVLLASGSAMVTDFGIAKAVLSAQRTPSSKRSSNLTQVGTTVGTPAYMAPEQIAADPNVDARSDVYSFGVMAYEMLAGGPPFASLTPQALLTAHLATPPRPLGELRSGLPPRLVALVMQCLEKAPENRPQSAREIVDALDDPAIVSTDSVAAQSLIRTGRGKRQVLIGAAVIVVGALAATYQAVRAHYATTGAQSTAVATNPDTVRAHSLFVMPFVNQSADSNDRSLAEGITSELVSGLVRVPGLRVASQLATMSGDQPYRTVQELGKQYNVGFVLEGTVRREGNQLQVAASLVDTRDGTFVWSDLYNRTMQDVFAVQQDISTSIANAIEPKLARAPSQTPADRGTADATAYEAYTRANGLIARRGGRSLHRALDTLSLAIRRDTMFARAYAKMAVAYSLLPLYDATEGDTALTHGIALASRALALDSTLVEAYAARASLENALFRWRDAERDYRRAIIASPRDVASRQGLGENLLIQGRVQDAVTELRNATALDPTSAGTMASYAIALGISGDHANAMTAARMAVALDSSVYTPELALGAVYIFAGHPDSALAPLASAAALGTRRNIIPSAVSSLMAYAYARLGDTRNVQSVVLAATQRGSPDAVMVAAHAALGTGNTTTALTLLDSAAKSHAPLLTSESLASPIFDSVRGSPKFLALLQTIDLPASLARKP